MDVSHYLLGAMHETGGARLTDSEIWWRLLSVSLGLLQTIA
jgi:hypothetical protein